MRTLYEVKFAPSQVWSQYGGSAKDTIIADIYDHWLEKADG